ncbi:MAG: DUF721 domain-containing protein [Deltaproteobacteria bacterium]|nr:DUF721 domain-containing protein [Deltaproteobacteria bacterium]
MGRRRAVKIYREPLRLGDFLHAALKRGHIHLDRFDSNLITTWMSAVGPQISAQTEPYKYSNKTLFVHVTTSTWMLQLQFMKQEIIEKINSLSGAHTVDTIFFTVGHTATRPSIDSRRNDNMPAPTLSDREMKLIQESSELVHDEELRSIIRRVMKKNIINRKIHGTP